MSENKLYEGKAKVLYSTENPEEIIQYFKDDATAFNNKIKDVIASKGILNNYISEYIMLELQKNDIPTHFIKRIDERRQLVKKCKIIPLEVIIRNTTAGSMAKRLGIEEGIDIKNPVLDLCYKEDALNDPLINEDQAVEVLKAVTRAELALIRKLTFRINGILQKIFSDIGIKLVDFKIEFGFDSQNNILLADEISPDSCRLWDAKTNDKLDKDRFRRGLGGLVEAYTEVANRLNIKID